MDNHFKPSLPLMVIDDDSPHLL